MISRPENEICLFRRFNTDRQKYWSSAGSADAKIAVPFIDKFDYFRDNGHLADTGAVVGTHDAIIIGMRQ